MAALGRDQASVLRSVGGAGQRSELAIASIKRKRSSGSRIGSRGLSGVIGRECEEKYAEIWNKDDVSDCSYQNAHCASKRCCHNADHANIYGGLTWVTAA